MDVLPSVLIMKIGWYLSVYNVGYLARVNKKFHQILGRDEFWRLMIKRDHPYYECWDEPKDTYKKLWEGSEFGYPREIVKLFMDRTIAIADLKHFDLKDRQGRTDYIDFVNPYEMPSSIMRFKDKFGRIGILLRLKAVNSDNAGTMALFCRYTDSNVWSYGFGGAGYRLWDLICKAHEAHHTDSCEDCPFRSQKNSLFACGLNLKTLENFIDKVGCVIVS